MPLPIDDGLFTWPAEEPQLIGGRCPCGTTTFPLQDHCPRCAEGTPRPHLLPRTGTLWTFTTQAFPPPTTTDTGSFTPFAVGYVDLGGEVLVEGRLTEGDPDRLAIGMPVELAIIPLPPAGDRLTFAFSPAPAAP